MSDLQQIPESPHTPTSQNFQVDLAGLVELLSRNLYSGPRVFVRELLQNGVDAITARRGIDPSCPARITFSAEGQILRIRDTGIGLTTDEAAELLATIGATSKRDEFGMARTDFLGQFGIGLLSCFMVSDTITVRSRSAADRDARTIQWEGRSNGTWVVTTAVEPLTEPGTEMLLHSLPGEDPFTFSSLSRLITEYGEFLPIPVELRAEGQSQVLTARRAPWEENSAGAVSWCAANFGFHPFAVVPVEVPEAGVKGRAFILPTGAHPGQETRHRVYLRRMLLGSRITELLPEWAYFARVVIDAEHLHPTASREGLFDDDLLATTREALGEQIRTWLTRLSTTDPKLFSEFIAVHVSGLKAMAVSDAPTREMVARTVPFVTSLGEQTFTQVLERFGAFRYTRTASRFRSLEPVARANGLCIVNCGYAFDADLVAQFALDNPERAIGELEPAEVLGVLVAPPEDTRQRMRPALAAAQTALDPAGVEVVLRAFAPVSLSVLFLPDAEIAGQALAEAVRDRAEGVWGALLDAADPFGDSRRPLLVLNARSPVINQLAGAKDDQLLQAAVRGLYVQALLAGQHPMDVQARSWADQTFTSLIELSLKGRS
ncbi:HSP90 family protein [Actinobaculum sp. 352]|uniref:HSP90 family protein n=1 Tax=Actinobaculum sp. 352 TaxID=2490946 RepID=UPI000F7EC19E|nr:HSP90 family protein [Actinobaculum sp. 352]RTE49078.1 HSP90 family protein [Actinobaculum sp. 352]